MRIRGVLLTNLLLTLVLSGVSWAGSKPPEPKPQVSIPAAFGNPVGSIQGGADWWKGFGDPLLGELIDNALAANPDLKVAAARLSEAEANRRGTKAALAPSVDANASTTRLRGGVNQGVIKVPSTSAGQAGGQTGGSFVAPFETSVFSGGMSMRWEADVFGGLRKSDQATQADARAARESLADARRILAAEVARNYVEMRAAEDQAAIVRANVAAEQDLLELTSARAKAGLATGLDVERQTVQFTTVKAELPGIDAQRLAAIYRISVLSGEAPDTLTAKLAQPSALTPPPIPAAIPGEVLKARPDLRRASEQISAAFDRAGSARADLYPKFVITGLAGRQSTDFSGLTLGGGNYFSIGPAVTLPIFNYGRIRAHIAQQDAQLQEALHAYERDVLAAFEETENALVARDRALRRQRELAGALDSARTSVSLSKELYVKGLGDFLAVLDAQRQQFRIERDYAAARSDVLRGSVALCRALGL